MASRTFSTCASSGNISGSSCLNISVHEGTGVTMSQPSSTSRASSGMFCSLQLRDGFEIAELQLRHAAAALGARDRHGDAVVLEDRGRDPCPGPARCGCRSRWRTARRGPSCPPVGLRLDRRMRALARAACDTTCCGTSAPAPRDARRASCRAACAPAAVLFTALTISATTGMPARLPTTSVELRILSRAPDRLILELERLRAQHQVREVDVPRMRRHVRTLRHVAHVAQVAVVDDVPVDLLVDAVDFAGRRGVDRIEQRRERVAQAEAAAAAVTDVEDPLQLLEQQRFVAILGTAPVDADGASALRDCLRGGRGSV